jgi:SAM-dependent methyltransferase
VLLGAIRRYAAAAVAGDGLRIVEIGGANSCFLDAILAGVNCRSYEVIDTNQYGLALLEKRFGNNPVVRPTRQSVLALSPDGRSDLVFSVGLVEHFDPENTRKAVLAHFDLLRPGGTAIITFPTPTWLYRVARKLIEMLGMWKFHDERPLEPSEVAAAIRERGDILWEKMMWPLILTQYLIVARKRLE